MEAQSNGFAKVSVLQLQPIYKHLVKALTIAQILLLRGFGPESETCDEYCFVRVRRANWIRESGQREKDFCPHFSVFINFP